MNALEGRFNCFKQHLTTGSMCVSLGATHLLRISSVKRSAPKISDMQNLGQFTRANIPFPVFDAEDAEWHMQVTQVPKAEPSTLVRIEEVKTCPPETPTVPPVPVLAKHSVTSTLREERKSKQRQEREKLMNGADPQLAEFSSVKQCPHCDKLLEGTWGVFKRNHLLECEARNLDRELNGIVGSSALIPKKRTQPDCFAITFTSLRKRQRTVE